MDYRRERIVCLSDRHRIEGTVVLAREGTHSRLSDWLNQRDHEFIPLENAVVRSLDRPQEVEHHEFLLVARSHLRTVAPSEDQE